MNDVPLPVEHPRSEGWGENLHERNCYLRHLENFGLKQVVSSGNARLRSNSFMDNTRAFTNALEDSLDVEDTGHVTIVHLLTNLLFSVFFSFICPFHVNCVFIPSKSLGF